MTSLFTHPPHLPLISASILSADFAHMGDDAQAVLDAGADCLHFDVMDGHFVPNLTMGPDMCRWLRRLLPETYFDVHLMVSDPGACVESFARAGASHLTFHAEVVDDPLVLVGQIHDAGMTAGIAVNPPTPIDLIDPALDGVEMVLLMSVDPGFSGQSFIESVLEKARVMSGRLRADQRLQVDGGVNSKTAAAARAAGFDCFAVASAIFGAGDYQAAIEGIRGGFAPSTSA